MTSTSMNHAYALQEVKREMCRRSLYEFLKEFWSIVESDSFIDNWHLRAICEHLEDVASGKIIRLAINIPPKCSKSTICSVFYPVWRWINTPQRRFFTGSHTASLAIRDSVKSRALILSPKFQEWFGGCFTLVHDQNQKQYYKNTALGARTIFSVEGGVTGSAVDEIIIDDPIDAQKAFSRTIIDSTNAWYSNALVSRLNSQKTGAIILVMQRLHQNDLTAHVTKNTDFVHLCLPMRFEEETSCETYRFKDPRKKESEILSPQFDEESLSRFERDLGSYGVASQLQQHPSPLGGAIIKRDWIRTYRELPIVKRYSWSWDTAIKVGEENDFSAGSYWAECENGYYLVDLWCEKVEYSELKKQIVMLNSAYPAAEILVEDKASGQQVIQDLRKTNLPIIGVVPKGAKEERLRLVSPIFEAGKVFIPESASYSAEFMDNLCNFPHHTHDDIADSTSQYFAKRNSAVHEVFCIAV